MAKKIIRTIISLIMPLAYMGFFGYIFFGIILDYQETYYKLTVAALILAFTASILILVWGLTEIEHIINYIVILVTAGSILAITWIQFMDQFDKMILYPAFILLFYLIYYIFRRKRINEIVVYMMINPIIYYIIFVFLILCAIQIAYSR